jgi:hypothetical protein
VDVTPETTVSEVKEKVYENMTVPTAQQRLLFNGLPIDLGDQMTLQELNVEEGASISVGLKEKKQGGGRKHKRKKKKSLRRRRKNKSKKSSRRRSKNPSQKRTRRRRRR